MFLSQILLWMRLAGEKERKKRLAIRIMTEREVGGEEFAACYLFYSVLLRRVCVCVCVCVTACPWGKFKKAAASKKPCLHIHTHKPSRISALISNGSWMYSTSRVHPESEPNSLAHIHTNIYKYTCTLSLIFVLKHSFKGFPTHSHVYTLKETSHTHTETNTQVVIRDRTILIVIP